jgi:hypothetical protein
LDEKFNDFIISLSNKKDFKLCTDSITYEQKLGAFDQELVLRFFALKNDLSSFKHDVADFLTDYMERVAEQKKNELFNYEKEEQIFNKTFKLFHDTLAEYSFGQVAKGSITRGFGVYQYEALTIGIQPYIELINFEDATVIESVKNKIKEIKLSQSFIAMTTGGGKNSSGLLKKRVQYVLDSFKSFFSKE